jgi:hypothetical protein
MDFDSLIKDIIDNPELLFEKNLTDEQLIELQNKISPYKSFSSKELEDPNYKKILVCSYTNLREEYLKKLIMTSLIGFIFQIKNEYETDQSIRLFLPPNDKKIAILDKLLASSVDEDTINELTELKNELTKEVEIPNTSCKDIINHFLHDLFKFDPNKHVKLASIDESKIEEEVVSICGNSVYIDKQDPSRIPYKSLLLKKINKLPEHDDAYSTIMENQENYNAICRILSDDKIAESAQVAINNREAFSTYLMPLKENSEVMPALEIIPPRDTFHRWTYYMQVNYEELRKVTASLYLDKPDIEFAIGAWTTFEGEEKEVDAEYDKYCQMHQSEFVSDIKAIQFGNWTLLGDFKKNREKINFYNKNTEALKRILDRYEDDKKLGSELMKNRIRQKKAKNIAEDGPDSNGLAQYRHISGSSIPGAEKVISNEEMLRLEKAKGNIKAAKELEYLEYLEEQEKKYQAMEQSRPLTNGEKTEYDNIKQKLIAAHEMAEVPSDGIQVDVFVTDSETGDFKKSSFYTKSEELISSHGKSSI